MLFNIFSISEGRRLRSQLIQKSPASDRGKLTRIFGFGWILYRSVCIRKVGTRWRSWLRHCTKSRMVAGSIIDRHHGSGVDSTSKTNEYQKYFLRSKGGLDLGLRTLPPPWNLKASTSWIPHACPGLYRDSFTFLIHISVSLGSS